MLKRRHERVKSKTTPKPAPEPVKCDPLKFLNLSDAQPPILPASVGGGSPDIPPQPPVATVHAPKRKKKARHTAKDPPKVPSLVGFMKWWETHEPVVRLLEDRLSNPAGEQRTTEPQVKWMRPSDWTPKDELDFLHNNFPEVFIAFQNYLDLANGGGYRATIDCPVPPGAPTGDGNGGGGVATPQTN
jgi:hypothetical protein